VSGSIMAGLGDSIRTLAYVISVPDLKVSLICNWRFLLSFTSVINNICSAAFLYICSETVDVIMWISFSIIFIMEARGSLVVKALCYKPEGSWFDTR
jgi:hypothetical protein